PLTREINVVAGQQMEVDGALQIVSGTLRVTLAPADAPATLGWRREGEETTTPFTGTTVTLPEGSYIILGHAPDFEDAKASTKVVAGRESAVVLVFKKTNGKKTAEAPKGATQADIEKAGGWTREGNVLVRTGGNVIVLPIGSSPGTYSFAAMMPKG